MRHATDQCLQVRCTSAEGDFQHVLEIHIFRASRDPSKVDRALFWKATAEPEDRPKEAAAPFLSPLASSSARSTTDQRLAERVFAAIHHQLSTARGRPRTNASRKSVDHLPRLNRIDRPSQHDDI